MALSGLTTALAHAGPHDPESHGVLHALTEPDHLVVAALVVGLVMTVRFVLKQSIRRGASNESQSTPSPSGRGQG